MCTPLDIAAFVLAALVVIVFVVGTTITFYKFWRNE